MAILITQTDRLESLRQILASEQSRDVTYEEAEEVAESLVTFFEVFDQPIEQESESDVSN